jgi:hypothetical protein
MKNITIVISLLAGWIASLAFCLLLWFENQKLTEKYAAQSVENGEFREVIKTSKSPKYSPRKEWEIFGLEDIEFFRNQGKVDGKIEALLMMSKNNTELDEEAVNKIIQLAEQSSVKDVENNPQFLSLLCQAAYHKGIISGEQNALETLEKEYENGYHAAIDDFTCPETGSIKMPSKKDVQNLKKP